MSGRIEATGETGNVGPVQRQPHEQPQHGGLPPDSGEPEQAALPSLEQVVGVLNASVRALNSRLTFSIDEASGRTVVKVIDGRTGEIIRQIPPEETLRLAAHIRDLLGVMFDEEV